MTEMFTVMTIATIILAIITLRPIIQAAFPYLTVMDDYKYQYQKSRLLQGDQNSVRQDALAKKTAEERKVPLHDTYNDQYQKGLEILQHLSIREKFNMIHCSLIQYSSKEELLTQIEKSDHNDIKMLVKFSDAYHMAKLNPSLRFCPANDSPTIYLAREVTLPYMKVYIKEKRIK